MPPVEFEPMILVSERPQTHALDRTATGIGMDYIKNTNFYSLIWSQSPVP
jgi:hypothetical protein